MNRAEAAAALGQGTFKFIIGLDDPVRINSSTNPPLHSEMVKHLRELRILHGYIPLGGSCIVDDKGDLYYSGPSQGSAAPAGKGNFDSSVEEYGIEIFELRNTA